MPAKKRLFKNIKKKVGNKSVNIRESIRPALYVQNKKEEKVKSPMNPQIIAENALPIARRFTNKPLHFWVVLWGIGMTGLMSLLGSVMLIQETLSLYQAVTTRVALEQQMHIWEDISAKYPTYRDANFQVALFAYRLGDTVKEKEYLAKTLALDPNFAPAKQLAE